MRDRRDIEEEVVLLVGAHVAEHLAKGPLGHALSLQRHLALDDHLGMGRHQQVVGFRLHDLERLAAEAACHGQFVDGLVAEARRHAGAADEPDDRVLAEDDGHLRHGLAPRLRAAISIFQPVWLGSGLRPSRRGPFSWQR